MRVLTIFLMLAMSLTLLAEESLVARFVNPSEATLAAYRNTDADIASYRPGEYLDVVMMRSEFDALRARGVDVIEHISEQQMRDHLTPQAGRPIPGYTEYADMVGILQTYAALHSDICAVYDIGDTWGKEYIAQGYSYYDDFDHDIVALKLSANVDVEEDEPNVFFIGLHHSREPISVEVTLAVLEHMIDNYGVDPEITDDIDNKAIWFVPMVNPNGGKIVLDQTDIWWRKNIRDNNNNHTFDSDYQQGTGDDGVDPNRNYGYTWGAVGSTDNPNGTTYHGPEEFSEPCTQAIRDMVNAHHFVTGLTYHSYGEEILYPYGYGEGVEAPDVEAIAALASDVADAINAVNNSGYIEIPSWDLYPTMGGTDDWVYGVHGAYCFTVELAEEFIPNQNLIDDICEENIPGAMVMLDRMDHATLTGHITDAATGLPLEAEVYVHGVDDTGEPREPICGDAQFGRYWRMLMSGTYTVDYRAYGYATQTSVVVITDDGRTIQDAALTTVGSTDFGGTVYNAVTGAPITGAVVKLFGAPFDPVVTGGDGAFQFDDVALGQYEMKIVASGYGLWSGVVDVTVNNGMQIALFPPSFVDNFENGLANWTTSGSWNLTTSQAYSPSNSLTDSPNGQYGPNLNTYATLTEPVDLSTSQNASVSMMAKWSIEADYDYCYVQARANGQTQWTNLGSFTGVGDWSLHTFDLSDYCGDTVQLRLRFYSDTYVTDDGVYIDDFSIYMDYPLVDLYGDVNDDGEITIEDAHAVIDYSVGLDPLPEIDPVPWEPTRIAAANVDGRGDVTAYDASLIWQYTEDNITEFPVQQSGWTPPTANITPQISTLEGNTFIDLIADDDVYGLNITAMASDHFMPLESSVITGENAMQSDMIGDVTNHYANAFLVPVTDVVGAIRYELTGTPTEDVVLNLVVNATPTQLVVPVSMLGADEPGVPAVTRMTGNYPNPFNPETSVAFDLAHPSHVSLKVYNIRGQLVKTLLDSDIEAGSHDVVWHGDDDNGAPSASGLYMFRLEADGKTFVRKGLLLK